MYYRLLIVGLLFGFAVQAQEKKFTLNGTLPLTTKKYSVLLSWDNGANGDEVKVINGKFVFNGTISEPVFATLTLEEINPKADQPFSRLEYEQNTLNLFLDAGIITVVSKTKLWDAVVKGSTVVNDYDRYQHQIQPLMRLESKFGEVYDAYFKAKNESMAKQVFGLYEGMDALYYQEQLSFVKNNPASLVSLYLTEKAIGSNPDAAKGTPLFNMLTPAMQNSVKGKALSALLERGKKTMVGESAIDFSKPDANGKIITLSAYKGKYVLVEFWASWCAPCRAESPNLVKAYATYHPRNFEIIGVSLDTNQPKWLKAISDDHYTWPQIAVVEDQDSPIANDYGVIGIPFNVLLDPNGIIIARNLRGDALQKKLMEVLK